MSNLSQKLVNWYHVPMVVRIRFGKSSKLGRKRPKNRRLALLLAAILPPTALAAGVLAIWRVAADLNWTSSFAISSGIFSYWQVWLGAAVALQLCARALNRYGKSGDPAAS
ncbi:MAG: hypothetical protein NTW28_25265 [Candidatus Solibacter sp.]|nr:hypothetical protein [Candidatus Solibacter sp.]